MFFVYMLGTISRLITSHCVTTWSLERTLKAEWPSDSGPRALDYTPHQPEDALGRRDV